MPLREIEIDPNIASGTSDDRDVIVLLPELDCLCIAVEVFKENKRVLWPLLVQKMRDSYKLLHFSIGVKDFDC